MLGRKKKCKKKKSENILENFSEKNFVEKKKNYGGSADRYLGQGPTAILF